MDRIYSHLSDLMWFAYVGWMVGDLLNLFDCVYQQPSNFHTVFLGFFSKEKDRDGETRVATFSSITCSISKSIPQIE